MSIPSKLVKGFRKYILGKKTPQKALKSKLKKLQTKRKVAKIVKNVKESVVGKQSAVTKQIKDSEYIRAKSSAVIDARDRVLDKHVPNLGDRVGAFSKGMSGINQTYKDYLSTAIRDKHVRKHVEGRTARIREFHTKLRQYTDKNYLDIDNPSRKVRKKVEKGAKKFEKKHGKEVARMDKKIEKQVKAKKAREDAFKAKIEKGQSKYKEAMGMNKKPVKAKKQMVKDVATKAGGLAAGKELSKNKGDKK